MNIDDITFGEQKYCEYEGGNAWVSYFYDVCEREYFAYLNTLIKKGYSNKEQYNLGESSVCVFEKNGDMLISNYYPSIKEVSIVVEHESEYLSFSDTKKAKCVQPLMTQIDLEDFGMSFVFRLCDGKFIIFDGGREFGPDADKLMQCLKEQSLDKKPIVAAWIFTHPHLDHYECFLTTYEKYKRDFIVERFIYNFTNTEESDFEKIPELRKEVNNLRKLEKYVRETGAKIYKAHTGQIYNISGAHMEILSSPDDTFTTPITDINDLSLVIKLTLSGQTILMCADAHLKRNKLAKRYGEYLKADILQPPHHMFIGGEIEAYNFINPRVCVVPSFEEDCFGRISPYQNSCKQENLHLFYNLSVEEFFTGSTGNVVLPLPYEPATHGRENYIKKLENYKKSLGAENWFYADITKEDCEFYFVNTTIEAAKVTVDIYAEEMTGYICAITFTIPATRTRRINIVNPAEVDCDALYYNPNSLAKKGIADELRFTAHIKSSVPIIVKGKRSADYHS